METTLHGLHLLCHWVAVLRCVSCYVVCHCHCWLKPFKWIDFFDCLLALDWNCCGEELKQTMMPAWFTMTRLPSLDSLQHVATLASNCLETLYGYSFYLSTVVNDEFVSLYGSLPTSIVVPADCKEVYDKTNCRRFAVKKNDPSIECPAIAGVGKWVIWYCNILLVNQ